MIMIFFQKLLMHFYPPRRHKMGLVELEFCSLPTPSQTCKLSAHRSPPLSASSVILTCWKIHQVESEYFTSVSSNLKAHLHVKFQARGWNV